MEDKILKAFENKTCYFFGLQHPDVYTCGIKTQKDHILSSKINFIQTRRGGSITYHNPGQLVFYTVVPLELFKIGAENFIRYLEAVMLEILFKLNIRAFILPGKTGIWTEKGKIGFIGIGMKKKTIYHGLALNFNNDLSGYENIKSCGLTEPMANIANLKDIYGNNIVINEDLIKKVSEKMSRIIQTYLMPTVKMTMKPHIHYYWKTFRDPMLSFMIGQMYFNAQKYWHSHEAWEYFWRMYKNTEFGMFLMGLIQLSSALYKLTEVINLKGSLSLCIKAQKKLENNSYLNKLLWQNPNHLNLLDYINKLIKNLTKLIKENVNNKSKEEAKKIFAPCLLILNRDYESIVSGNTRR